MKQVMHKYPYFKFKKSEFKAFACVFIFSLFLPKFHAQSILSAEEAVSKALENNFQILIAKNQLEIAVLNNKWSEAGMFPTVSLTAGLSNNIQDNTKNPFTFTPGIILSQGLNAGLNVNWNLFAGRAVWISKERLNHLQDQSLGNAKAVIETTVQDVLKAYYSAVLQRERLKMFQLLLKNSRERVRYYEVKEKYAQSSSLEFLQFKNQYLSDSTNVLVQQVSFNNAQRNLNILMNLPESETEKDIQYIFSDSLNVTLLDFDLDKLKSDLLANNQNLKNQFINLELQKTMVEYQRSFLYPTLTFQAGVSPSYTWFRDLKDPQSLKTQTLVYSSGLNLRYNLFNNWKTQRALEVAKIQENIADINVQSLEKNLLSSLSNLAELYQTRSQLLSISTENLVYAKKLWELAQKRFELGSISSIELSNVQNSYQNTLIQHYENLYNRFDTYIELLRITGKLGIGN